MSELQKYDAAKIAKIEKISEAVYVKKMAESAEEFYRAQKDWKRAQKAKEIAIRSIWIAGRILLPPDQGGKTKREQQRGLMQNAPSLPDEMTDTIYQQKLKEANISDKTGFMWQKVARIPEDKLEVYFTESEYKEEEYSISGLMVFAGEWYGRSDIAEWSTPQWLFDILDKEFHFTLDVCAHPENAKCKNFYSKDDDALNKEWHGICWMNPPYGREISDWMIKALLESQEGATVVCLVPARPDTEWWWNSALFGEIRFIKGRLKWQDNSNTAAPFPSAVIILGSEYKQKVVWWDVQQK